ncbi:MAG: M28 family peptidase [bacterium]
MRKAFSILFCILIILPLRAQEFQQLLDAKTRDLLHEALSGELAKEYTIHISRFHRIQGSREYRKSAEYVIHKLREFGFDEQDAYIESFKSDGKIHYQTWQSPSGWDVEAAELRMLEPFEERIVGYPEIPMSLITYSNPGDVTAELIWVGSGTQDSDYQGKDVRGKFVLATGYGGSVHRLAVLKYGAKVVVCYLDDDRAKEYPDMLAYTGMWPTPDELDRVTFGFNLTNRQGEKLKDLLEAGRKVVLRGWVKGIGLEPYWMDVPVAHIRGSEKPDEEFIICGHLDHPKESANDNASGSAAMLDICRALKELIDQGRLPRPKRSIRVLWVPEFHGPMAYIDAHPEIVGPQMGGKYLAGINLDMVGEHLEIIHTNMNLTRTPCSLPSIFNDVMANMAEMVDRMNIRTPRGSLSRFNYRVTPYSGGSDHVVLNDLKIPSSMIGHGDYTHHTSEDTPDKVDPVELERAEIICAAAVLYLANLDASQASDLVCLAGANAAQHLGLAGRKAVKMVSESSSDDLSAVWTEAQNTVDHALAWEKETVASVLQFNSAKSIKELVKRTEKQLAEQHAFLIQSLRNAVQARGVKSKNPPSLTAKPDPRVPVRLTRGPLGSGIPQIKLTEEEAAWYQREGRAVFRYAYEIVNFIDEKRTVSEIRNAVSAEYSPIQTKLVARYIEDLIKAGVVRWK